MTDLEKTLRDAATKLLEAYDCRKMCITGYQELVMWQEINKENEITDRDVELVARYVKAHRAGKFGDNQPSIPQSPQRALESFPRLLCEAQAKAAQMAREKQGVRCEKPPAAPWESEDYQEPGEIDFAELREFKATLLKPTKQKSEHERTIQSSDPLTQPESFK